MYTVM